MSDRSLGIVLSVNGSGVEPGFAKALAEQRRYADEVKAANAEAAKASQAAVGSGAVDVRSDKVRQHQQEQIEFYRRIASDSGKSESMRAKARERYTTLSDQMELQSRQLTAQQEQAKVRLTQAACQERIAAERKLLAERLAAEEQAGQATSASAGGVGTGGTGGGPNYANRRLVKQELKYAVGNVAGMEGGPAGMIVSSLMYGSAPMAAAAGAMATSLAIYNDIKREAKDVLQIERERLDNQRRINESLEVQASNTARGSRFADAAKALRESADATNRKLQDSIANESTWDAVSRTIRTGLKYGLVATLAAPQLSKSPVHAALEEQRDSDRARAVDLQKVADLEAENQHAREAAADAAALEAAQLQVMVDGPQKQRLELLHRQNQESQAAAQHWQDTRSEDPEKAAQDDAAYQAHKLSMAQKHQAELGGLDKQTARDWLQGYRQRQQAEAGLIESGYDREREQLRLRQRDELADAKEAHKDTYQMERRHTFEVAKLTKDRDRDMGDTTRHMQEQAALASHAALDSDVQWAEMAIDLKRKWGDVPDAIEEVHQAFLKLSDAKANQGIVDAVTDVNLQLEHTLGHISDVQLAFEQLKARNREADAGKLAELAQGQHTLQIAEWSKQRLDAASPMRQYREFAKKIQEAIYDKRMTYAEGREQLQDEVKRLSGNQPKPNYGQAMDPLEYVRHIQQAVNKPDEVSERILGELRQLNAIGLRLKAS